MTLRSNRDKDKETIELHTDKKEFTLTEDESKSEQHHPLHKQDSN